MAPNWFFGRLSRDSFTLRPPLPSAEAGGAYAIEKCPCFIRPNLGLDRPSLVGIYEIPKREVNMKIVTEVKGTAVYWATGRLDLSGLIAATKETKTT